MKVDLGIWDRLSRLIVVLLVLATALAVALWYLPQIQKNQETQKQILQKEEQITRAQQEVEALKADITAFEDPQVVERKVRERLNYARSNETLIHFKPPPSPSTTGSLAQ